MVGLAYSFNLAACYGLRPRKNSVISKAVRKSTSQIDQGPTIVLSGMVLLLPKTCLFRVFKRPRSKPARTTSKKARNSGLFYAQLTQTTQKKSRKYTKRVDADLHIWCNASIAATTTAHPSPVNTGATPSTLTRHWHQRSAAEVANAMGATVSTGSDPVFQKSHAHAVRSPHAERPRAPSHQRARPLLCAASLPYPAAKVRTRSKG